MPKGWEIYPQDDWGHYRPDFVVERKFGKKIQRVIVEVKSECKITKSHIKQINEYTRKLSGGNVKIKGKLLIVPAGCDTSLVPDDIEIIYLRGFKCD